MPVMIVKGRVKKVVGEQPSPEKEAAEKTATAKEKWKKAKKAAKKETEEKRAREAAEGSPQDGTPSPGNGGSPGKMKTVIDKAKASMSSTQADNLERMLASAESLPQESKVQLALLLQDIKQQAQREEQVNTGWKCLKQSATFVRHVSKRQDRLLPPAGPGGVQSSVASSVLAAGADSKERGGTPESGLPSPAKAQWNKVKSLKSVASLAKDISFSKVLQQQAEPFPPSKGSELDQDDGVYKDASSFQQRRKPSEWGKVRAASKVNNLAVKIAGQDEVDEEKHNSKLSRTEEDPPSPSKYATKLPEGVLELERARQEKESGKIAQNAAKLRLKKLEKLHSEAHQGPLVGYSRKFVWKDLCLAASSAALSSKEVAQRGEVRQENSDSEETSPARKTGTERHNYSNSRIHSHVHLPSDRLPQARQPFLPALLSGVQNSLPSERKGSDGEAAEGGEGETESRLGRCGDGKGEDAVSVLGLSQRKKSIFSWFLRRGGEGAGGKE